MPRRKSMKNEPSTFMKYLDKAIKDSNPDYDIKTVAAALGISKRLSLEDMCDAIVADIRAKSVNNNYIQIILDNRPKRANMCDYLVKILYSLLHPKKLPSTAPIGMSEAVYNGLVNKKTAGTITANEEARLNKAMYAKYCYCIKTIYLKNLFNMFINGKQSRYNLYAICTSSLYKKRNLPVPPRAAIECKDKFKWYE